MKQFRGIVESPFAPSPDMLWIYQNELKYFSNGEWKLINNPRVTEEVPSVTSQDSNTLDYIILEVGKTKKIKTSNLSKLSENKEPYFVSIKGGFGVYTWNNNGGQAHIINAYGDTSYYSISSDGSVEKSLESPDIYLDYVNAGGKKSKAEFVKELVDLIG